MDNKGVFKRFKSQIDDLVNDPNFIRLGELLAEKRELQQIEDSKIYDNAGNKLKKKIK
jgi:hypothetical protein